MLIHAKEWRADILEEHVEELGFLWNRRLRGNRSVALDGSALWRLDRRIEGHADALILAGEQAAPLLWPALTGEEIAPALGAAQVLTADDSDDANHQLIQAVHEAPPLAREGVRRALVLRCGPRLLAVLGRMTGLEHATVAATAATIVAAHGQPISERGLDRWVNAAEPEVRLLAWLGAGRMSDQGGGRALLPDAVWRQGLRDPEITVLHAALIAAVRRGSRLLLPHLREIAARPSLSMLEEHLLFAMLSTPEDASLMATLASSPALGWERFRLLAAFGRPAAGQALLLTIEQEKDPVVVALAGAALTQLTGIDSALPERIPVVAPGTPAEDTDLADEIKRCDPVRARHGWEAIVPRAKGMGRLARGYAVDDMVPAGIPGSLDLEARFAIQVRAAHAGRISAVTFDDESFPLPRPPTWPGH